MSRFDCTIESVAANEVVVVYVDEGQEFHDPIDPSKLCFQGMRIEAQFAEDGKWYLFHRKMFEYVGPI